MRLPCTGYPFDTPWAVKSIDHRWENTGYFSGWNKNTCMYITPSPSTKIPNKQTNYNKSHLSIKYLIRQRSNNIWIYPQIFIHIYTCLVSFSVVAAFINVFRIFVTRGEFNRAQFNTPLELSFVTRLEQRRVQQRASSRARRNLCCSLFNTPRYSTMLPGLTNGLRNGFEWCNRLLVAM